MNILVTYYLDLEKLVSVLLPWNLKDVIFIGILRSAFLARFVVSQLVLNQAFVEIMLEVIMLFSMSNVYVRKQRVKLGC